MTKDFEYFSYIEGEARNKPAEDKLTGGVTGDTKELENVPELFEFEIIIKNYKAKNL